jgi:hypothetical protein
MLFSVLAGEEQNDKQRTAHLVLMLFANYTVMLQPDSGISRYHLVGLIAPGLTQESDFIVALHVFCLNIGGSKWMKLATALVKYSF